MIKSVISISILLLSAYCANAQYYYKDIVSNKQLLADMNLYKANKIKSINLKSFEDDGSESEGFFCEKKISNNYKKTELFTRANIAAASLFTSIFDNNLNLISTNDSSSYSISKIQYTYDDKNRIQSIKSSVYAKDDDFENSVTEEHFYSYENDKLTQMLKTKNGTDKTIILFAYDDNGNIAIEKDTKSGIKYYYYYDAKNRLTDIVQQNEYQKNLRPNYVFEYNSAGLITQMTAIQEGSRAYFVWKYTYENGLRVKERCFTDERRLLGTVEYEYK